MALPKLRQLLIPHKVQKPVDQPAYGDDMRAIESWALQVIDYVNSIPTSGGYASLTGPGQTSSPGALTQNGNLTVTGALTVNASTNNVAVNTSTGNIDLTASSTGTVALGNSSGGANVTVSSTQVSFTGSASGSVSQTLNNSELSQTVEGTDQNMEVVVGGAGTTTVFWSCGGSTSGAGLGIRVEVDGVTTQPKIGFYGATPIAQPAAVTPPTGGTTIDSQARTAINAIITILHDFGMTA